MEENTIWTVCVPINKCSIDLSEITSTCEVLFIENEIYHTKNNLIGIVYRKHTNKYDFLNYINILLDKLDQENKNIILMGDFNMDLLKVKSDNQVQELYNLLTSASKFPHITRPTRITEKSATLIDQLWSNILEKCVQSNILLTDFSDHLPVCSVFCAKTTNQNNSNIPILVRNFKELKLTNFRIMISRKKHGIVFLQNKTVTMHIKYSIKYLKKVLILLFHLNLKN